MRLTAALGLLLAAVCGAHAADNVVLSRLGKPGDMQMTVCVGDDRATVRETRQVYLDAGAGQVTFSWTDADIDPASLRLTGPAGVTVGNASRVPGDDRALAWDVQVGPAGVFGVTFNYTVKGLRWRPVYTIAYDQAGGKTDFTSVLQVNNDTKVDISGVKLSLLTGRSGVLDTGPIPVGAAIPLSEAISLEQGWGRTMPFLRVPEVPTETVFRLDRDKYGEGFQRVMLVHVEQSPLPKDLALPAGKAEVRVPGDADLPRVVRIMDLSPKPGEALEIPLGREDDLVVERKLLSTDKTAVEFDRYGKVSGFDTVEDYRTVVRNRLAEPVHCELIEPVLGAWELATKTAPKKLENNIATFDATLKGGESLTLDFRLTKHSGTRIK
jgi:hypothetical protein